MIILFILVSCHAAARNRGAIYFSEFLAIEYWISHKYNLTSTDYQDVTVLSRRLPPYYSSLKYTTWYSTYSLVFWICLHDTFSYTWNYTCRSDKTRRSTIRLEMRSKFCSHDLYATVPSYFLGLEHTVHPAQQTIGLGVVTELTLCLSVHNTHWY